MFEEGDLTMPYGEGLVFRSVRSRKSFKNHMNDLETSVNNMFNKTPPRQECCFKPTFAPWGWYNEKHRLGEELGFCDRVPRHRIGSKEMGVPLDYCKEHFKIASGMAY